MPKVSVCIPVYNVEQYIGRCIESVISQSLKDIEIIFVNDCTPDKSMEIVRQYAETDKRIVIVEHDVNHGLMMARRTGYMAATGDYITFCDSDDIMPSDAVETLYNCAIESGADIVSGDMEWLYEDGTTKRSYMSLPYGSDSESVYRALLSFEYSHTLCSKLFQNSLLQSHEYITLMHATNGEDGMLFYQVLQHAKKIVHQNKVVYSYWQNVESSTHNANNLSALDNMIRALSLQNKMISFDKELLRLWKHYMYLALTDICRSGNKLEQIKPLLDKYDLNISLSPLRIIMHCGYKAPSCLYHLLLKK